MKKIVMFNIFAIANQKDANNLNVSLIMSAIYRDQHAIMVNALILSKSAMKKKIAHQIYIVKVILNQKKLNYAYHSLSAEMVDVHQDSIVKRTLIYAYL